MESGQGIWRHTRSKVRAFLYVISSLYVFIVQSLKTHTRCMIKFPGHLSFSEQQALVMACEAFEGVTQRYKAEPGQVARSQDAFADASIRFKISGKQFDMPVVVKPELDRQWSSIVLHRKHAFGSGSHGRPLALVTQYVPAKLASDLIAMRIPFLDAAGNVYLDEPEVTIMITGREKPAFTRAKNASRSTTPKGLRVMFALVSQPGLVREPYRAIAEVSGVALNTVNVAMDDLIARGLVAARGDKRVIVDWRRVIEDWVSLYPTRLRPKLGGRRFASSTPDWWRKIAFNDYDARLGGEAAAESLTHELRSAQVTVYAHTGVTPRFMTAARLRPDERGEVEILEAFWPATAEGRWQSAGPGLVHPLLIYADLIASGDSRNHSVAQNIYDQFLATPRA
jgi:hypothetical protein